MKFLDLNKETIDILKNEANVVVYRAGFNGKILKNILGSFGILVTCYVVNDESDAVREYNELPVYSIRHLPVAEKEIILLVALNQHQLVEQMEFISSTFRFKKVLVAKEEDISSYCIKYCEQVFQRNGIELENEVLDLSFVRLHNPFKESWAYQKAFALQAKDLILPLLGGSKLELEGPYEYNKVSLKKGDVVFDCGANIGLFSAYAAAKGCYVYAFEPSRTTAKIFALNQRLYPNQITLVEKALGEESGLKEFYIHENDWGGQLY